MPSKKIFSSLFGSKAATLDAVQSVFCDFYLVEQAGKYILQLGLHHSFNSIDNMAEELPIDYKNALSHLITMLTQLKLIPVNSNYILFGNAAVYSVINNQNDPNFIECNATHGNHVVIHLESANTVELNRKFKEAGLIARPHPYTVFETISPSAPEQAAKSTFSSPM